MVKKLIMLCMIISMLLIFAMPVAAWDPNMGGGGGAIGGGGGGNVWHSGQDGVRVTFVDKATGHAVTTPVDLTNGNLSSTTVNSFQGQQAKNKTYYAKDRGGLNYRNGNYKSYTFAEPIPAVIGSSANIEALKARFQDIWTIQGIVEKFIYKQGDTLSYSSWEELYSYLANGNFAIMVEPIAYFYFNSNFWAMTATEAALYNTSLGNGLHSKMGALTQCALPLSLLLASDQAGYWVDQSVYNQRNNMNFRFSSYYGSYTEGDRGIVHNGVGLGLLTTPGETPNNKPDLTVSSITTNKSTYAPGETITVNATVTNTGAVASNGNHYIKVEDEPLRYFTNGVGGDSYVASGGSYRRTYTFTAPNVSSSTNITLRSSVDYTNAISESNENNNTKDVVINVSPTGAEKPDLTVTSIVCENNKGLQRTTFAPGELVTIKVKIKNIGAARATNFKTSLAIRYISETTSWEDEQYQYERQETIALDPQEEKVLTYTWISINYEEKININAIVDCLGKVDESNEKNNNLKTDIVITNDITDLTAQITTDKATYLPGETVTVTGTQISSILSSRQKSNCILEGINSTISINPQTTELYYIGDNVRKFTFVLPDVKTSTPLTLRFTVDYDEKVDESNEDNNSSEITITVGEATPEPPELDITAKDYTYYTDTQVITPAIITSNTDILPGGNGKVFFTFFDENGEKYKLYVKEDATCPSGKEQLVWSKWVTPDKPQKMTARLIFEVNGTTAATTININIIDLEEKTPPDTTAKDEKPNGFNPIPPEVTAPENENSWNVWEYEKDKFIEKTYTASLVGNVDISPHSTAPTAEGDNMKSGYGVGLEGKTYIVSDAPTDAVTAAGKGEAVFPEFIYKDYDRVLDISYNWTGAISDFTFSENPDALSDDKRVHFVPLWYPDGDYRVYTKYFAAYTPAGELKLTCSDTAKIDGDLYDDWSVTPSHPTDLTR